MEAKKTLELNGKKYTYYSIKELEKQGVANIARLPFSIRVLLENVLRNMDGKMVTEKEVRSVANWKPKYEKPMEIGYFPGRVLMQDFTGVPAMVDLAVMRDALKDLGKDPSKINPLVPVDLVIDHSVQIDYYKSANALNQNVSLEYQRNKERYTLLKWAQKAFDNVTIFPPNTGICHQVNLEYIAKVVMTKDVDGETIAYPDTLVGTDSHTTMINCLGVMGWGVGGIEAEAAILGQPCYMPIPEVVGVKLTGKLQPGATATDLALTITQLLRQHGVVAKFVEYFGSGVTTLSLPNRSTVSNMSPEYGATMGFFPVDEETIKYLKFSNRIEVAELVEKYTKEQDMFFTGKEEPEYSKVIELDLSTVVPSLAGHKRPQDRIPVPNMKKDFEAFLQSENVEKRSIEIEMDGEKLKLNDGSVVIASITSCTNTSNPFLLIGAGLIAKNAAQKGLKVKPYVKTSFAPGSRIVPAYLEKADLMKYLESLGFHIVAFGCAACIGNSGPLPEAVEKAVVENDLRVGAVVSGNRNFEARIHALVRGNYLASPMLVVAYALAGRVDIDLTTEAIGTDKDGNDVFLRDIWPDDKEVYELIDSSLQSEMFAEKYKNVFDGDYNWKELPVPTGKTFQWDENSTYIRKPPFFDDFKIELEKKGNLEDARVLALVKDSITTDHISPAGAIPKEYPAGKYLREKGVEVKDFNSYGSRRGNHEVMMRGTLANVRIKNALVAPKEGGFTKKVPENKEMYIYDAAMEYIKNSTDLLILAGKEYGTGSSRDWAAKGTILLGVKCVLAESFERIHRSNLVGMGVLPALFKEGDSWEKLGLDGFETFSVTGIADMVPGKELEVTAIKENGEKKTFSVISRLDTPVDVEYFENGGILQLVLRNLAKS